MTVFCFVCLLVQGACILTRCGAESTNTRSKLNLNEMGENVLYFSESSCLISSPYRHDLGLKQSHTHRIKRAEKCPLCPVDALFCQQCCSVSCDFLLGRWLDENLNGFLVVNCYENAITLVLCLCVSSRRCYASKQPKL